jgi:hypothetical protein
LVGGGAFAQTTTTLAVTAAGVPVTTAVEGTVVTLTATVTAGGAPITPGQVNFCEAAPPHCTDIHLLGTAQLTASGVATIKLRPGPGNHTYQAFFLGTNTQRASSSAASALSVSPFYPTTTTIGWTGYPGNYSLIATVTSTGGTLPPTGTATFMDTDNANYVLGTAPLVPTASSTSGLNFVDASNPVVGEEQIIAVADFNGDGKPDFAAGLAAGYPSSLVVFLGNGDGTFKATPNPPIGSDNVTAAFSVADFNGDGIPDIALPVVDKSNNTIADLQILLGNGDGTFTAGQTLVNTSGGTIATGDFNGDGIPDLALAGYYSGAGPGTSNPNIVSILLGNGDGTFSVRPSIAVPAGPLVIGDFNGDGKADLAIVIAQNATNTPQQGAVTILLGNGDGTFTAAPSPAAGPYPYTITAADFNGDGILDLAIGSRNSYSSFVSGSVAILLGNGDGTFRPAASVPTNGIPESISVGDFNGDGKPDMVVANTSSAAIFLGDGDGTFAPGIFIPSSYPANYAIFNAVAAADFNGSGLSDFITQSPTGAFSQTTGIELAAVYLTQAGPQSATATITGISPVGTGTHYVDAAYSGDGAYQRSLSGTVGITALPVPTTLTLTANPTATAYGQQVVLAASIAPNLAQNHYASGTVTFTNGSTTIGIGTIANGVATLNISNLTVGTDNLTAAYSGDVNFVASTGTATEIVTGTPTTTSLAAAPNPAFLSQTVTLTATVSSAGSGSSATPAGTSTFYDGSTMLGTATLTAGTVAGSASATFATSTLTLGTHSLSAVYVNNGPYYGSTGSGSEVITTAPTSTSLRASPNPAGLGQTVTLTTTVSGTGAPTSPAGSVTFYDGSTPLGTATLNASGSAAFTTSTLALGKHSLTAVYAANGPYSGSTSAIASETIDAPDFTIALASPTLTIETYHHATTSVALASLFGFTDNIALTCVKPPQYVTCIFTPSSTPLAGTASVSLYLDTDSRIGGSARNSLPNPFTLAFLFAPFSLLAGRRWIRGRGVRSLAALSTILLSFALGACASNVSLIPAAAPGTYFIPVTATGAASNLTHSANLILTVTP